MRLLSWWVLVCLSLAVLLAENGRDFAGQYAISNVVENGETVNTTLTVRLINYSGRDIAGARLLLQADPPAARETALATDLALANHTHKTIRADITISKAELDRWQRGAPPHLAAEFADGDGRLVRRPVELVREPRIEEEQ